MGYYVFLINVTNYKVKNKEQQKYYISQVSLLDLKDNVTHFVIEKKKVIIYVKASLKYIIQNPILQINYLKLWRCSQHNYAD